MCITSFGVQSLAFIRAASVSIKWDFFLDALASSSQIVFHSSVSFYAEIL